jgi:hypothetical protein
VARKKLKEFITLGGEVSQQASKFMEGCTHVQFEITILKFILKRGVFLYFKPTYMGLSQLCVYIHYYRKFITAGSRPPSPTVLAPLVKVVGDGWYPSPPVPNLQWYFTLPPVWAPNRQC